MTPDIRTFRAASMREALDVVRREMGSDAVILHTKQHEPKPGLLRKGSGEVEITAGLGVNIRAGLPTQTATPPPAEPKASPAPLPIEQPRILPFEPTAPRDEAVDTRLSQIERILAKLESRSRADWGVDLEPMAERLRTLGLPESSLADWLADFGREVEPAAHLNSASQREWLVKRFTTLLGRTSRIRLRPNERRVVALVGPTGVGKTTTIAKLAANFRLHEQLRMGLVTVDTYRIAAVEQLRTYADIIDLPMKVVTNPLEMTRAMESLDQCDLVLIDTAGRSPQDEMRLQELRRLLEHAGVDEVHLVLSVTASMNHLQKTIRRFESAGITSIILSKLDEVDRLGDVLPLFEETTLPISYVTVGQDVPKDIEAADPARLVHRAFAIERQQQAHPQPGHPVIEGAA